MIRLTTQDLEAAIDLLQHEQAHEPVGNRELAERDEPFGARPYGIGMTIGSTDREHHGRMEAGLVLVGSEVKSLRDSKVTMADGWVEFRKGQAYLHGIQINEYAQANRWQHDVARVRKLLMHKREIDKLATKTTVKGYTLIPLSLYFKGARVKVELGLVTHKKQHDKRESKREADDKRDMDRAMKSKNRAS